MSHIRRHLGCQLPQNPSKSTASLGIIKDIEGEILCMCVINSICFSTVFSLRKLFYCHCWNFPYEKHIHHLLSQMPKQSAKICYKSESVRATLRGPKECHHGNQALILHQPPQPLSEDCAGHSH